MSPFDLISWKTFNDLAHWAAVIGLGVWGYLRTKDKDNAAAVASVSRKLDDFMETARVSNEDQNTQLALLRERVAHMPTEQDIARLGSDLATVKAQVNGVANLVTRIEHQTNLIHEHLLKNR